MTLGRKGKAIYTCTSFLRKAHTQSAKKWLERLQIEKVPVLVCLTFGDKLYAEHMIQGKHLREEERYPPVEYMKHQVKEQLLVCFNFTTTYMELTHFVDIASFQSQTHFKH